MPLYEFQCAKCEKVFEELVSGGTQRWPCPDCGTDEVQRVASVAAFTAGSRMATTGGGCSCGGSCGGSCSSGGCGGSCSCH